MSALFSGEKFREVLTNTFCCRHRPDSSANAMNLTRTENITVVAPHGGGTNGNGASNVASAASGQNHSSVAQIHSNSASPPNSSMKSGKQVRIEAICFYFCICHVFMQVVFSDQEECLEEAALMIEPGYSQQSCFQLKERKKQ